MLIRRALALSLCAALAQAFRDTSPFLAFSTSDTLNRISLNASTHILPSHRIDTALNTLAKRCPSDTYILVSQPGLSPRDLSAADSAPQLAKRLRLEIGSVKSSISVTNAVGTVDLSALEADLKRNCNAAVEVIDYQNRQLDVSGHKPAILKLALPALPLEQPRRADRILSFDSYLNELLNEFTYENYTLIYTSTPSPHLPSPPLTHAHATDTYTDEPTFDYTTEDASALQDALHIDLKRDVASHRRASSSFSSSSDDSDSDSDDGGKAPLFERYNFLSPGIYMGLVAAVLLLPILYVGISAVSSIEVSYAAFSKEMGPGAQRKAQ